jgi:hypothetical protein
VKLRQSKKYRLLRATLRKLTLASTGDARYHGAAAWEQIAKAPSHDDSYWMAAQLGLTYDADAGWYIAERPTAAPSSPFDVRLEGPHATLVAAEALLRTTGITITKRSGPRAARGGVFLTYLTCRLPRAQKSFA